MKRILITGATGLIGSALAKHLVAQGSSVAILSRAPTTQSSTTRIIHWDPESGYLPKADVEGMDVVVHLAGENIARGRWTEEKKRRIFRSRVRSTELLVNTLTQCTPPPSALICASAIGYYGDRNDEMLTESSSPGCGFLADTCVAWEAAAHPACDAGIRTISLRIGMVLSSHGGAIPRLLLPFRLGMGGPIGDGNAWMSWIALRDLVNIIDRCIEDGTLSGPINATSPCPTTNQTFTQTLAHVLKRPAFLRTPAVALKLAYGQMAQELLLTSIRVIPERLQQVGFHWKYSDLESALRACIAGIF